MSELEHLIKWLPDKVRAKLVADLAISERTLYRWMEQPRQLIGIDAAITIKRVLDKHYRGDHDINALTKPVRIRGRKAVTA